MPDMAAVLVHAGRPILSLPQCRHEGADACPLLAAPHLLHVGQAHNPRTDSTHCCGEVPALPGVGCGRQ